MQFREVTHIRTYGEGENPCMRVCVPKSIVMQMAGDSFFVLSSSPPRLKTLHMPARRGGDDNGLFFCSWRVTETLVRNLTISLKIYFLHFLRKSHLNKQCTKIKRKLFGSYQSVLIGECFQDACPLYLGQLAPKRHTRTFCHILPDRTAKKWGPCHQLAGRDKTFPFKQLMEEEGQKQEFDLLFPKQNFSLFPFSWPTVDFPFLSKRQIVRNLNWRQI